MRAFDDEVVNPQVCAERHRRIDEKIDLLRDEIEHIERAVQAVDKKLWGGLSILCLQLAGFLVASVKGCL